MSVLKILQDGDPILRKVCEPVVAFDYALTELAADMADTMIANNGIGIAANQVGRSIRLIVVSTPLPLVIVNPVIKRAEDYQVIAEGCLSVPRQYWNGKVSRRKKISVSFQDADGVSKRFKAHGLIAAVVQHEIDHLDGKLFTDYTRPLARPADNGGV